MTTTVFYSSDNESFNEDSLGDLIDGMDDPQVGDTYYEADGAKLKPTDGINKWTVGEILENMDERISDDIGEIYDNTCSQVSDEAKAELHSLLEAWATKHIDLSNYWRISGKSRECKLTADDLGLA
jgi:hypothetical protein